MLRCRPNAGNAEGFSITPVAAGHLLGGCAWRITTPGDEDIVYAVHYNHRKQARAELGCSRGAHEHCMTASQACLWLLTAHGARNTSCFFL